MGISVKVNVDGAEQKARDAAARCRTAIPSRSPSSVGHPFGEFLMHRTGIRTLAIPAAGVRRGEAVQRTVAELEQLRAELEAEMRAGGATITGDGGRLTIEFAAATDVPSNTGDAE